MPLVLELPLLVTLLEPEEPELTVLLALPPLPDRALLLGDEPALPEPPDVLLVELELLLALPELALPPLVGDEVAAPEPPLLPDEPVVAVAVALSAPVPPVSAVAAPHPGGGVDDLAAVGGEIMHVLGAGEQARVLLEGAVGGERHPMRGEIVRHADGGAGLGLIQH